MHTADTQFAHWLSWFVDPDSSRAKTAFVLPNGWVVATDGRAAVATPNHEGANIGEVRKDLADLIANILAAPSINEKIFSRDNILMLFGQCDHPKAGPCSYCHGTGEVPHDCNCDLCDEDTEPCDCEGEPSVEDPEKRPCAVFGKPFDANLIAYILEHTPPQEQYALRISPSSSVDGFILSIVTTGWSAMVAPLSNESLKHPECRELMEEPCSASTPK